MYLIDTIREWLLQPIPLFEVPKREPKTNRITDYLKERLERVERLRGLAIKDGNINKKLQADRIVTEISSKLNARYSWIRVEQFN